MADWMVKPRRLDDGIHFVLQRGDILEVEGSIWWIEAIRFDEFNSDHPTEMHLKRLNAERV
jgi:hypothetical protein